MNSPETVPTVPLLRQIKSKALEILGPACTAPSWSDVSSLAALVDQMTLADVGLSAPTPASEASLGWGHTPPTPYEGKIKFMQLASCRDFEIVVIILPAKTRIPLHDHPGMLVLSRLLCGEMRVRAFDLEQPTSSSLDNADEPIRGYGRAALQGVAHSPDTILRAQLVHDKVFSAPATLTLLPEECGNIHAFEAITPCAVFDVLAPPYDWGVGRGCQYFGEGRTEGNSHELLTCEPPVEFSTSRWEYSGPNLDD